MLFFRGCSEVNSTWLITSELPNQLVRKVLFTCVVYTKYDCYHMVDVWEGVLYSVVRLQKFISSTLQFTVLNPELKA